MWLANTRIYATSINPPKQHFLHYSLKPKCFSIHTDADISVTGNAADQYIGQALSFGLYNLKNNLKNQCFPHFGNLKFVILLIQQSWSQTYWINKELKERDAANYLNLEAKNDRCPFFFPLMNVVNGELLDLSLTRILCFAMREGQIVVVGYLSKKQRNKTAKHDNQKNNNQYTE